jgi:formylmethanofuran dehydrogenase subunit E
MNEQYFKDVAKGVKQTPLNQELSPGSTKRRYEPAMGTKKHNERIHKESKMTDGKNLPFDFRKPPKPKGRSAYVKCDNCGYIASASTATCGIICPECKKFSTVTEVQDE